MKRILQYNIFIAVLLLFSVSIISAQESTVKTGVCLFSFDNDDDSVLANGVASAFFESVSGIRSRRIKKEEITAMLSSEHDETVLKKRVAIEKLYTERDRLLFTTGLNELEDKLVLKDAEISKSRLELAELLAGTSKTFEDISPDAYSDLELQIVSPEEGPLFIREPGIIGETAEKNNLDLVVYGSIERIDDYRYIEVRLWNQFLGKDIQVWKTAAPGTDVIQQISPGIERLKTLIIGRDWAEVSIKAPENSLIYINDNFSGIGKLNRLLVDPGRLKIEVRKKGYETVIRNEAVELFGSPEFSFELQKKSTSQVVIQTFPSGADIYLDSVWIGTSPQKFEREAAIASVTVMKDGYDEIKFFIDDKTETIVNLKLKPLSDGRSEYVSDQRDRFYTSMGMFILSLPATSILYNMVKQTVSAYNREYEANKKANIDELRRIESLNGAQYSLYLASIGMNIIFFLDTIIKAADYVGGVEYFSN